jgi:hypothetical protein
MVEKLRHNQSAKEFSEKKSVNNKMNSKLFEQSGDLQLEVRLNTFNTQGSSAI